MKHSHIVMIIDRSGSMSGCWEEIKGSYKAFVEKHKKENSAATFSLVVFDYEYEELLDFIDINKVSGNLNVGPRGVTALYDAIGMSINSTKDKIKKMGEGERPSGVLFIIQTDGYENASKEWRAESIKKLIDERKRLDEPWEFLFVGATEESVMQAKNCGININTAAIYNTSNTSDTFDILGKKSCCFVCGVNSGLEKDDILSSVSYTVSEREKMLDKQETSDTINA